MHTFHKFAPPCFNSFNIRSITCRVQIRLLKVLIMYVSPFPSYASLMQMFSSVVSSQRCQCVFFLPRKPSVTLMQHKGYDCSFFLFWSIYKGILLLLLLLSFFLSCFFSFFCVVFFFSFYFFFFSYFPSFYFFFFSYFPSFSFFFFLFFFFCFCFCFFFLDSTTVQCAHSPP